PTAWAGRTGSSRNPRPRARCRSLADGRRASRTPRTPGPNVQKSPIATHPGAVVKPGRSRGCRPSRRRPAREGPRQERQRAIEPVDGAGVAVVELLENVADAGRLQPSRERAGAPLEVPLVAAARVQIQQLKACEGLLSCRVVDEPDRVVREP